MAKHRTYSTEFKRLPRNTLRARLFRVCAHGLSALERGLCVT